MRDWVRSQRGASLPLALLLTLVCAMAASVVIAAGTAASGRLSNLEENDQAYYSVASAVNVFRDELIKDPDTGAGHSITVAVKFETNAAGTVTSRTALVQTDGATQNGSYTLLERSAMQLLFGNTYGTAVDNASAQNVLTGYYTAFPNAGLPAQSNFAVGEVGSFDLSVTGLSTEQQEELAVVVEASVAKDGSLNFEFRKPGEDASKPEDDRADFRMKCDADIEYGEVASGTNATIQYVTITWTPSTIEKGPAGA